MNRWVVTQRTKRKSPAWLQYKAENWPVCPLLAPRVYHHLIESGENSSFGFETKKSWRVFERFYIQISERRLEIFDRHVQTDYQLATHPCHHPARHAGHPLGPRRARPFPTWEAVVAVSTLVGYHLATFLSARPGHTVLSGDPRMVMTRPGTRGV